MSVISSIIKTATRMSSLESYDSYLFIGPHPDDIELGAGATAAKLVKAGKQMRAIFDCHPSQFPHGSSAKQEAYALPTRSFQVLGRLLRRRNEGQ